MCTSGEEKLASFFVKVQAVEESFLLLEVKERGRALNILQSSVNKLLNFVGEADIVSASLCMLDICASSQENKFKQQTSSSSLAFPEISKEEHAKKSGTRGLKQKPGTRGKRKRASAGSDCMTADSRNGNEKRRLASHRISTGSQNIPSASTSLTQPEAKHEVKNNFHNDLQELADFDCGYDFNPNLQQTSANAVSQAGTNHMSECSGKFSGKMLGMSATSDGNNCPTSVTQSQYPEQLLDVSTSHEGGSCEITHSHYGGPILANSAGEIKGNCAIPHAASFRTTQIIAGSQMNSGGETSQYTGGVMDTSADPSQYTAGVMESNGASSQYAGGVIDSSGGPSQYASDVIDSARETSQYRRSMLDSTGETSQYGGVLDMSVAQEVQNCNPSHAHAQYPGAMIPTAQDVTVCTTSQYAGTVLAMSLPETMSYSTAHYSHTIMQGVNCAHPQLTETVLDMSTAASRQCEASHPSTQYAGTIFEGSVIGTPASAACSPFQFRRPMFEAHEAFHRSQELTQSLVHASMLQQQQLYQLHHQTATSRWRIFVCRGCGEAFTHHRSVKAHLLTHGSSPLSCRFCHQNQVNQTALLHHLCGGRYWKHSADISREIHMCCQCGKFFSSRHKLRAHSESEHGVELPRNMKFTCRFCGLQLTTKVAIFLHYRQHAAGRFVCYLCGAILNDFVQYASHMAYHIRWKKKRTCQQCDKVFRSRQSFAEHLKTHPGHTCPVCQKKLPSLTALKQHQTKSHNVETKSKIMKLRSQDDYHCRVCQKQFADSKELLQHSHLHTAEEKPLHCGSCQMSFRTTKALTKHRQTLSHCRRTGKSQENQHLCSECGKAYFRHQALQRHLRHHQSSKPFICQYCNFRCSEKDNLRRHTARHFSTQRNFICELCGAAFHAKKTLEMHHSYKHSTERRFKCSECPMTFKARNALGRHSKTHSRTREHGCWCGAAFNRLYNLRRHMRLVHGSDDALPPVRKVEVLDLNQSVKQAISTPPAKKMLVKTRKVKADCMQKEQEAAAAAVVVGGEEGEESGIDRGGGRMDREGVQVLSQVGMTSLGTQNHQVDLENVDTYSGMPAAAAAAGVVGQTNVIHPISHAPHPHITMEQGYAMVSATLHHNLHHDPQQTLTATTGAEAEPVTPHPTTFSHTALDYSQLPNLSTMLPYSANNSTSTAASTVADASAQRQDYYPSAGAGMDGMQQSCADYTTSPFSFIQNFLLPSVGVANLLDLAHASGAK